jgi:hypothetical protein
VKARSEREQHLFLNLINKMAYSLLLVEDTKTIAESIKKYLELDGHKVM